jgi:hypothetical protein
MVEMLMKVAAADEVSLYTGPPEAWTRCLCSAIIDEDSGSVARYLGDKPAVGLRGWRQYLSRVVPCQFCHCLCLRLDKSTRLNHPASLKNFFACVDPQVGSTTPRCSGFL